MYGLHVDFEIVEVGFVQLDTTLALADLASHFMECFDRIGDKKNVRNIRTFRELCCKLLEMVLPDKDAERAGLGNMEFPPALHQLQRKLGLGSPSKKLLHVTPSHMGR